MSPQMVRTMGGGGQAENVARSRAASFTDFLFLKRLDSTMTGPVGRFPALTYIHTPSDLQPEWFPEGQKDMQLGVFITHWTWI